MGDAEQAQARLVEIETQLREIAGRLAAMEQRLLPVSRTLRLRRLADDADLTALLMERLYRRDDDAARDAAQGT